MRKLLAALAVVSVLVAGVAATTAGGATKKKLTVTLRDNYFSPKTLTVADGTTIYFAWGRGGKGTDVEHNVTGTKGNEFEIGDRSKGIKKKTFTKTTTIYCTIHPTTMKLTVKVK
jgi:plastocyanin